MKKQLVFVTCVFIASFFLYSCARHASITEPVDGPYITPESKISVESPVYGENLLPGKIYKVKWNAPQDVKKFSIALYRKGVFQKFLRVSIEDSTCWEWKIPVELFQSVHYKLKIADVNHPDWNYGWSGNFFVKPGWIPGDDDIE